MNEQIKMLEKELSDEEIANLSDLEFKTVAIRLPREMIEYECKIKDEVKSIQSKIKKKYTGNQQ